MKNVTIIGRLGADAVTKEFTEGKHVMEMNVFVPNPYKKDESQVIKVQQYSSKPFNNTHLFKKGNLISAAGFSEVEAYINKDGVAKASETLTASNLHLEVTAEANKATTATE